MTLEEGKSIDEEVTLIETQIAKMKQERDERAKKLIEDRTTER